MSDKATGLLDRLLAFMDKPWKAIVVVVLVIVCGAGYLTYLSRAEIAQAILRNQVKPRLDEQAFRAEARTMLSDADADAAVLDEVRLIDNTAIVRASTDRSGKPAQTVSGPHQAIGERMDPKLLTQFLQNETVCFGFAGEQINAEIALLTKSGFTYGCVIQVPPVIGTMVGALIVAWRDPPDPSVVRRAEVIMRDAALKFAVW